MCYCDQCGGGASLLIFLVVVGPFSFQPLVVPGGGASLLIFLVVVGPSSCQPLDRETRLHLIHSLLQQDQPKSSSGHININFHTAATAGAFGQGPVYGSGAADGFGLSQGYVSGAGGSSWPGAGAALAHLGGGGYK